MLLPSVEKTSSTVLNRQKKTVAANAVPTSSNPQATDESQTKQKVQHRRIENIQDKNTEQPQAQQEIPQALAAPLEETSFSTASTHSYSDFTLDLNSTSNTKTKPTPKDYKPDELRYGRKRPPLPVTFSFGVRRPQAVAVAMRHPLLEGKQPTTAAQAILDTLDLAATNRLPYTKGSGLSLVA